jgi:hypothetical protein
MGVTDTATLLRHLAAYARRFLRTDCSHSWAIQLDGDFSLMWARRIVL